MKIFSKPHLPFCILSVSVMFLLTLPSLMQDGMFMDAMLYTSVSRNLSNGIGTFWFPYFDPHNIIGLSSFHEQPPLAFGIQALFFKIVGDHLYMERLYTLFTLCTTAFLIHGLWQQVNDKMIAYKPMSWLPILLWITIPVCFWSYSNNMHENTMGIFILLSVMLMYKALQSEKHLFLHWVLAGVLVGMAALCKGFPGLFPLSFPFLYWAVMRQNSFKKMALQTAILLCTLGTVGFLLYLYPPSRESLSIYLFKRAFARIDSAHTVDSRFFILFRLLSELLPQIGFTCLFFLISRIKKIKFLAGDTQKKALLFLMLALCGTLPLMLTKVQNGFYMVGAFPYFAIAFALLNVQVLFALISKISKASLTKLTGISILLFAAVLLFSFSKIGDTVRDKTLLHDVHVIGKNIPAHTSMAAPKSVYLNWTLGCYLVRYYNISLNMNDTNQYYLSDKNQKIEVLYPLQKMDLPLELFDLYKKR